MTSEGDEITLHGMAFHTRIGILPHERDHPQPIEIDLTVWLRKQDKVLDYRGLYADAREAVDTFEQFYLEELAESIATRVLARPAVRRTRIAIRKPHVAIGGPLRTAEVVIVRPGDA